MRCSQYHPRIIPCHLSKLSALFVTSFSSILMGLVFPPKIAIVTSLPQSRSSRLANRTLRLCNLIHFSSLNLITTIFNTLSKNYGANIKQRFELSKDVSKKYY